MENLEQQTLSGIVLKHRQVIPVLEKYNLDFCCRGKKTLSEACAEKNINLSNVIGEMQQTTNSAKPILPFGEMNAEQLISYILIHHHFYVRNTIPVIINHLEKVVLKHGDRHPDLKKVFQLFTNVKDELETHMQKEESLVFPGIKEIAALSLQHKDTSYAPAYITASIQVMEADHDNAGQLMFEIRDITNNYTAPEDACTTYKVCLEELKAFEADLHKHVHLENNILFPMAAAFISKKEKGRNQ
jgi:regulator of cell morphogenesis and NO signaling